MRQCETVSEGQCGKKAVDTETRLTRLTRLTRPTCSIPAGSGVVGKACGAQISTIGQSNQHLAFHANRSGRLRHLTVLNYNDLAPYTSLARSLQQ